MSVRRSQGPPLRGGRRVQHRCDPFTHCADPSLTCLVTLEAGEGDKPLCTEAHCGVAVPTTSTTTTTTTLPCVSTPSVSGCFEDLGDCTIRDSCIGLQWEKKQTVPGPHDVNNRYV